MKFLETQSFDQNGLGKTPKGKPVLEREILFFPGKF